MVCNSYLISLKGVVYIQAETAQLMAQVLYTGINFLGNNFVSFRNGEKEC